VRKGIGYLVIGFGSTPCPFRGFLHIPQELDCLHTAIPDQGQRSGQCPVIRNDLGPGIGITTNGSIDLLEGSDEALLLQGGGIYFQAIVGESILAPLRVIQKLQDRSAKTNSGLGSIQTRLGDRC